MSTQLPLNIEMGALSPNQAWTPQQLADAIAARLRITTQAALALFVAGSTAPTSDSGPWWKDNATWYRWDAGTGTYVPQLLEPSSLGYWIGDTAPDPNVYRFWIETAADLQPLALKTYYSGAWTDVYAADLSSYLTIAAFNAAIANYSTTAQMNTAISNAISAAQFLSYPAQGVKTAQTIDINGVAQKIEFGIAPVNPSPAPFDTAQFRYIAPAGGQYLVSFSSQFDNVDGVASGMEVGVALYKNNSVVGNGLGDLDSTPSPNGSRWSPSFSGVVTLAANDYLEIFVTVNDGTNTGDISLAVGQFSITRVRAE